MKWQGGVSAPCINDRTKQLAWRTNPYLPFPEEGIALSAAIIWPKNKKAPFIRRELP